MKQLANSKTLCLSTVFCFFVLTSATDITEIVFGPIDDAIPAAYGDFNSDELTDVFVLRDDFKTIEILLGADVDHLLHKTKLRCHYPKLHITSVVPGDFDGDAFMDVMFTARIDKEKVGVYINWGGSDHMNCTSNDTQPLVMTGEPLALDYNDDMVIDLFGMDENGTRTFWIYQKGPERKQPTPIAMTHGDEKLTRMNIPHSHSFLDLNDDFYADLFITNEDNVAEVWLSSENSHQRFEKDQTIKYDPPGATNKFYGQSLFLDVELDGKLNQLLPVCHDEHCKNSTIWVQSGKHYHDFKINFFQDDNKTQWGFLPPDHKDFYRRAITLRTGDFNNDGYPDLLVTLQKNGGNVIQTFLLENVKEVNAKPTDNFKRTFAVRWNALLPFGENTVMGSFYDFYQDGILDVILLQKNGDKYKPLAFRNTLDYDANFVKVIVLTGLTNIRPPAKETPFGAKRRNYGKIRPVIKAERDCNWIHFRNQPSWTSHQIQHNNARRKSPKWRKLPAPSVSILLASSPVHYFRSRSNAKLC